MAATCGRTPYTRGRRANTGRASGLENTAGSPWGEKAVERDEWRVRLGQEPCDRMTVLITARCMMSAPLTGTNQTSLANETIFFYFELKKSTMKCEDDAWKSAKPRHMKCTIKRTFIQPNTALPSLLRIRQVCRERQPCKCFPLYCNPMPIPEARQPVGGSDCAFVSPRRLVHAGRQNSCRAGH